MPFKKYLLMAITAAGLLIFGWFTWKNQCPNYTNLDIPNAQPGKFNIAMVLSERISADPWSKGHFDGLLYLQNFIPDSSIFYLEGVPEFCASDTIFNRLADRGYRLVIGAAFGYMDSMERAAGQHPETTFIHVLGLKSNRLNFDNLNGALEDMVYLAGMLAGGRAQADGNLKLGFIATLPVPEEMRMINAAALGMAKTCPACKMEVRWLNAWKNDEAEKLLAAELFDGGAQVVFSGSTGYGLLDLAATKVKYGIPLGSMDECAENTRCLTAPYWIWGPVYGQIARKVQAAEFRPETRVFHADSGGLGLLGFDADQQPLAGAADLPPEVLDMVRTTLARMQDPNQQAWREIFAGPITDNQGKPILAEGEFFTRTDTDQFPPGAEDDKCKFPCMYWYASGITSALPDVGKIR